MKITNNNPWDILEIQTTATQEEIKQAFKKKAMLHHPDRGGDIKKFRTIAAAYEKLRKNTVVPIVETPSTTLVNVTLTVQQQIEGVDDYIETDAGDIIKVAIPSGASTGDKFKVKTDHENIIINIKEKKHPHLTRHGNSLIMYKNIDIVDAMCGNTIVVEGPCGEDIEIKLAPGTDNTTSIVIPDKGLYNRQKRTRGGLHLRIEVKIPKLDTDESISQLISRLKNEY